MAERVKIVFQHFNTKPSARGLGIQPTSGEQDLGVSHHIGSGQFNYTLDNGILTPEQRKFYEDNGFLVIKKVVTPEKLDKFRVRFRQICNGEAPRNNMTVMRDVAIAKSEFVKGERAITKLQNWENDEVLFSYCSMPEIIHYVRAFLGNNIMAMHTMLINKPPDPGSQTSRHPMHQDLHYFPFRPADKIVCAWTAMQTINRHNGCLVAVPGTHKGELKQHEYPEWEGGVNKMYHGLTEYDPSMTRVHLEMEEGDTVFFHPLLWHGSGTNRSDGFRKSISCHYAAAECTYMDDIRGTEHENIAREVIELVGKKRNLSEEAMKNVRFADAWRYKARLVHGVPVNM